MKRCERCHKYCANKFSTCPYCDGNLTPIQPDNKISVNAIKNTIIQEENIPKCPVCGSKNLKKISVGNKVGSAMLVGVFAVGHIGKTYKCLNCGEEF